MPYVTSVERLAREEGKVEGGAGVLLRQLTRVYGPLPPQDEQRIRQLPIERLEELAEAVLDFRALEDLQLWLDECP